MSAINDQAIALRRLDYSETSQVLLFLTRAHGPRRLIAKGIKRGTRDRFAVGIDLLERGDVTFIARAGGEGSLGTLTEWRQVTIHAGLRGNLGRLYAAQYAAEITAAMIEEADPHPELYDALCRLLERLAEGGGGSPHSGPAAAGA
ncbi:MAG: DNA repair protein RecO, partial [Phycisphaerae bacterium]